MSGTPRVAARTHSHLCPAAFRQVLWLIPPPTPALPSLTPTLHFPARTTPTPHGSGVLCDSTDQRQRRCSSPPRSRSSPAPFFSVPSTVPLLTAASCTLPAPPFSHPSAPTRFTRFSQGHCGLAANVRLRCCPEGSQTRHCASFNLLTFHADACPHTTYGYRF